MSRLTWVLIAVMLIGCGQPSKNESSNDVITSTVEPADTITALTHSVRDTIRTKATETLLATLKTDFEDNRDQYFEVSVSTQQYESASEVNWFFNKEFDPVYFKETWALEGTEGDTEYFAVDGQLQCVNEQESYGTGTTGTIWCLKSGGHRVAYDDERGEDSTEPLPDTYAAEAKIEFARKLSILTSILKEGSVEDGGENFFTIKIESDLDGEENSGSTEVRIPKVLYEELTR